MRDIQRIANISNILKNSYAVDILMDLIYGEKPFNFFSHKYGHDVTWVMRKMVDYGLIVKRFDKTKVPIGYVVSDHGRMIAHACIRFEKELLQY